MELSIYGTSYNNADRIKDSLDSIIKVLENVGFDSEVVIVDNRSNDGTAEVLDDFSARNSAIHIMTERCKRGKGRAIAAKNSSGRYLMHVDFDTIYDPILSDILQTVLEQKRDPTDVIDNVLNRDNLLKSGNWRDLNASEDVELFSRLIRNGSRLYAIPARWFSNQPRQIREDIYASTSFRRGLRKFDLYLDKIRGMGIENTKMLTTQGALKKIGNLALIYYCRLSAKEIYTNSDGKLNNYEFLARNRIFLSPREFGVSKEKWIYHFSKLFFTRDTVRIITENIKKAGLDISEEVDNWVLLYTKSISADVLGSVTEYARTTVKTG